MAGVSFCSIKQKSQTKVIFKNNFGTFVNFSIAPFFSIYFAAPGSFLCPVSPICQIGTKELLPMENFKKDQCIFLSLEFSRRNWPIRPESFDSSVIT